MLQHRLVMPASSGLNESFFNILQVEVEVKEMRARTRLAARRPSLGESKDSVVNRRLT